MVCDKIICKNNSDQVMQSSVLLCFEMKNIFPVLHLFNQGYVRLLG